MVWPMQVATPSLVVLVGPSGSGKSTWARDHFDPTEIVSSDDLRAAVGLDRHDMRASTDAFAVLNEIVDRRLNRGLTTVIDSLGLNAQDRASWVTAANAADMPAYAVAFHTEPRLCRSRNKERDRPVPAKVLTNQIAQFAATHPQLAEEGFTAVIDATTPLRFVTANMVGSSEAADRQQSDPRQLDFGLQLSVFNFAGGAEGLRRDLAEIASVAEDIGFTSIWVMDHMMQIPQIGPEWWDLPEAYTTLAYLAGVTKRAKLGTLVTGIHYRNPALLAKMIATLDVVSGGRAIAGLGAGWFERETKAYGWDMPTARERLDRLEDALQLLPLMWGPGSPEFVGKTITVPEAICYPRPLQDRIPILVGGSGEKRTLRLVAEYADAANFMGDTDLVTHKLAVLHDHCRTVQRDPESIEITHLGPAMVGVDETDLDTQLGRIRPPSVSAADFARMVNAGLVDDHIGKFRQLAEAGVQTAIVSPVGLSVADELARYGSIIEIFSA